MSSNIRSLFCYHTLVDSRFAAGHDLVIQVLWQVCYGDESSVLKEVPRLNEFGDRPNDVIEFFLRSVEVSERLWCEGDVIFLVHGYPITSVRRSLARVTAVYNHRYFMSGKQ